MAIWLKRNFKFESFEDCCNEKNQKNIIWRMDNVIDSEVKRASLAFLKWIVEEYNFPKKVVVHFFSTPEIEANDGEMVSATCFLPYNKKDIPYIRIATGDYEELKNQNGKDRALAAILHSLAHEFTHYFQWIKNIDTYDEKMEKQAVRCADYIIRRYAKTRKHP